MNEIQRPTGGERISRRALLKRAAVAGVAAVVASTGLDRGGSSPVSAAETMELPAGLPSLTEAEVGYAELIEPTTFRKVVEAVRERTNFPIETIGLNPDLPDARERVKLSAFDFFAYLDRRQSLISDGSVEADLAEGNVPNPSDLVNFAHKLGENAETKLKIKGLGVDSTEVSEVEFIANKGVNVRVVDQEGVFNVHGGLLNEGFTFTPRVDKNGQLQFDLSIADMKMPSDTENFAGSMYSLLFNAGMEFLILTGGSQELWDQYCASSDTQIGQYRQEHHAVFGSIADKLFGAKMEDGSGWAGPNSIVVTK